MNARRTSSVRPRSHSTPSPRLAFGSSTAGWYAEWKARKQGAPTPAAEPQAPPADDAAEALAKWLTGDVK
ncbi:MAG TPA: hypothetical protein VD866_27400 [Urbifossiella sp.]|nr:hypothetical protein [Urbifossiella sp.]